MPGFDVRKVQVANSKGMKSFPGEAQRDSEAERHPKKGDCEPETHSRKSSSIIDACACLLFSETNGSHLNTDICTFRHKCTTIIINEPYHNAYAAGAVTRL